MMDRSLERPLLYCRLHGLREARLFPDDRGTVVLSVDRRPLSSRHSEDSARGWILDAETKKQLLERIALAMPERRAAEFGRPTAPPRGNRHIPESFRDLKVRGPRYLNWLAEHTGPDSVPGLRYWRKYPLLAPPLREYLAACCLFESGSHGADLVMNWNGSSTFEILFGQMLIRLLPRASGSVFASPGFMASPA